jgi:Recombinase
MLNREGVPCPSALRPEQNRHRLADGWQGSTVRAILDNPRYTGYAVFGRWTRHETLLDPDDVAAGHVIRFRRAASDRIVRSRVPAHPTIVSVEVFTAAQLICRRKSAGGLATARKSERGKQRERRTYVLRGLVRCGVCQRKLSGEMVRKNAYYRCAARTLAPGSAALADHPITVNLREDVIVDALNRWIGRLFARENLDQTVAQLLGSQPTGAASTDVSAAKSRRADAERRLQRFQAAIAAGADPAAVIEPMNQAQAERAAARAEIDSASKLGKALDVAEVYAMIDSLGDVGVTLAEGRPAALNRLYKELNVSAIYQPEERAVDVTARPRVDSACVRGRSCALTTRLLLPAP